MSITDTPKPAVHSLFRPHPGSAETAQDPISQEGPARRHPIPQPPTRLERQPVLRGPVQDPEIPARLPGPVRDNRGRPAALPDVLPLVQRRAPPHRPGTTHPGRRPPRPSRRHPRRTRRGP